LVYEQGIGVDRNQGQALPEKFVPVFSESELGDGELKRAEHDGVPILLVRRGKRTFALAEKCSHLGGPLSEGKLRDNSVQCPWHGSRFSLEDGQVLDGPAVHPQPCLEARVRNGKIEVRKFKLGEDRKMAPAKGSSAAGAQESEERTGTAG
jgi:nitrite reductase/ring-hydroxylating ferredoxin subunit